jgi:hypothetical protein
MQEMQQREETVKESNIDKISKIQEESKSYLQKLNQLPKPVEQPPQPIPETASVNESQLSFELKDIQLKYAQQRFQQKNEQKQMDAEL